MSEERPLFDLSQSIEYKGPLREVFLRGSELFSEVEFISNGAEFTATVNWFSYALEPNRETLRVLFINRQNIQRVVLAVDSDGLRLERIVGLGEKEESELVFSKKVQSQTDSAITPDWSIKDLDVIPEQSLVEVLNELDPRVAEEERISLTLRPAKEIAELIGQNLGVLS
jgi:hypothetical protein